jgi:hypothetical protein
MPATHCLVSNRSVPDIEDTAPPRGIVGGNRVKQRYPFWGDRVRRPFALPCASRSMVDPASGWNRCRASKKWARPRMANASGGVLALKPRSTM